MSESTQQDIADVTRAIRSYLETHRQAADTIEGIAKWWLLRQRYEHAYEDVKQALERLVSQGLVVRQVGGDGRAVYRIREPKVNGTELNSDRESLRDNGRVEQLKTR